MRKRVRRGPTYVAGVALRNSHKPSKLSEQSTPKRPRILKLGTRLLLCFNFNSKIGAVQRGTHLHLAGSLSKEL